MLVGRVLRPLRGAYHAWRDRGRPPAGSPRRLGDLTGGHLRSGHPAPDLLHRCGVTSGRFPARLALFHPSPTARSCSWPALAAAPFPRRYLPPPRAAPTPPAKRRPATTRRIAASPASIHGPGALAQAHIAYGAGRHRPLPRRPGRNSRRHGVANADTRQRPRFCPPLFPRRTVTCSRACWPPAPVDGSARRGLTPRSNGAPLANPRNQHP